MAAVYKREASLMAWGWLVSCLVAVGNLAKVCTCIFLSQKVMSSLRENQNFSLLGQLPVTAQMTKIIFPAK